MPKYPKNFTDVDYDIQKKGWKRRRKIAGSTKATADFLVMIHEMYPTYTIRQIKEEIEDRRKWIYNPEAVSVLDAYIKNGCEDSIPEWR